MFELRTHWCNATPIAEITVEPLNGDTVVPKSRFDIETYNIARQNLKPFGFSSLAKSLAWIWANG